ncbi:hypothetical protein [Xylophilus ampelinus]|uniref:Uncharacterized protein n=1 Tax=Xylophilus ampelinus TaxID=54067 RepID=A0A318SV75_9BURK|nr:hypothetical protein [Xylophilus ampelinus]MCS4511549.1 hypothetical protein [Xylophilus ampelinus]PYE74329.1 hypothetical protein DFQ15_1251 [Xylophilus ampelinus]
MVILTSINPAVPSQGKEELPLPDTPSSAGSGRLPQSEAGRVLSPLASPPDSGGSSPPGTSTSGHSRRTDVSALSHLSAYDFLPGPSGTASPQQSMSPMPIEALERLFSPGKGMNTPPSPERLAHLKKDYGATSDDMARFTSRFEARLVPTASAGLRLQSLNDHTHILKLVGHGPHGMTMAERLPVVSVTLPGETAPRYFIKGYGDRLIKLADLETLDAADGLLVQRLRAECDDPADTAPETDLERAAGGMRRHTAPARGDMETPLRSDIKALSMVSELHARRSQAESDDPIMQEPWNPSAMPLEAQWWSTPETATLPGFGPTLPNGLTALTPHVYGTERMFLITSLEGYEEFQGRATLPHERPLALRAQTAGDLEHPPSAVNVGGPVLAKIRGINQWEVVGPDDLTGVKTAKGARAFEALRGVLHACLGQAAADASSSATSARPVVIRFTTDDQAVHELTLSHKGVRMKLVHPVATRGYGDSAGTMQAGHGVEADIDVYSYEGQFNGVHASRSGTAEPALVVSTGETLPAGPLIRHASSLPDQVARTARIVLRLMSSQPVLGVNNERALDWMANIGVKVATKVGVVWGFNMLGRMAADSIGVAGLSSQGGGDIGVDTLAKAVSCMVVSQEATTFAMRQFGRMMPTHFGSPEGRLGRFAVRGLLPGCEEMLRLCLNMELQKSFGLNRGNAGDVLSLACASVAKGGVEWLKSRAGNPVHHAAAHLSLTLLYNTLYNLTRGVSNAFTTSGGDGHPAGRLIGASLTARLIGRADTLYEPMMTTLLNSAGVVGENASAYDHQMSHETQDIGVSMLDRAITELSNTTTRLSGRKLEENRTAMMMLLTLREGMEGVRQHLSRFPLERDAGRFSEIGSELAAVQDSIRHASQPMDPDREREMDERLQEKLESLIEATGPAAGASDIQPLRYDVGLLDPKDRATFEHQSQAARYLWTARGDSPQTSRFQEVNLDYSGRGRPAHARAHLFLDTANVPRDATTWTRRGQMAAWPTTALMAAAPGIHTPRGDTDLPPVSRLLRKRATSSAFLYTVESGTFHLPLRFDYIGQLQYQPIRANSKISVPHMVLTAAAHSPDGSDGLVDPRVILDVNLAARYAPKYPANLDRAAVTEAAYIPPGGQTRFGAPVSEGRAPTKAVTEGEVVALTEMYSATTSGRMAAYFGAGINAGAPRDRSLRIHAKMLSGVNFAKVSDLAQGEVVSVPGMLLRVLKIDPDAGKGAGSEAPGKDVQDLGQVVYFEQINTYEFEKRFHAMKGPNPVLPGEGDQVMEPRSGHLLKATGNPAQDGWVFDLDEDRFRRFDAHKDAGRQVLEWTNNKSYFLGRGLEDEHRAGENGPAERSRWFFPYSGDQSMRAIKEATHAAILGKDLLVTEGLLDIATENVHHAHFREAGGYADTPEAAREQKRREAVREAAAQVSARIGEMTLSSPLSVRDAESFSWLLTSLLRKRIELVTLDDAGHARRHTFDTTYDKIDLKREAELSDLAEKRYEPAHVIVVSSDGVHVQQIREGQRELVKIDDAEGPTLGGLVHAVIRQAYPEAGHYTGVHGDNGSGARSLHPDSTALRSARDILDAMKDAAKVRYLPLQAALVKQFTPPIL